MANRWGNSRNSVRLIFLGSRITADGDCSHGIKRCLLLGRKAMTNLDSVIKNQRHHFADNPYSQSYDFSSSHVQMWKLDHKEGWALKNRRFQTVVLEKTLDWVPWTARSNQPILKEINPEYSMEELLLKLKLQYFAKTPDAKSWLTVEDPDAGKAWK